MSGDTPENDDLEAAVRAAELGCETFYIPGKDDAHPGRWHFTQKYDQGVIWKRYRWPWIALRGPPSRPDTANTKNFSKQLQSAESYLKDAFPNALIPRALLSETLKEAHSNPTGTYNAAQGQLLDLGITRYVQQNGIGRRTGGQWKRLCIAFCSGELRTDVSIALIRWYATTGDGSQPQLRVPFMTERSQVEVTFKRPIQQIVFPGSGAYEDLCDFFAVRTMTEVAILACSRTQDKRPFVRQCSTLPLPSTALAESTYIADVAFNSSGSQIATVTDKCFWAVYDVSVKMTQSSLTASGSLELPELSAGERRSGWAKIAWIEQTNDLLIAESKGLHLLNFNTGSSDIVLSPSNKEHYRGLATIDALGGFAYAILTSSEILIVESSDWAILVRQKHRRDPDPSLIMKLFSIDDVTNIFLYSRLNPLITVHQLSEEFPLSWLDTPFELPLPREEPSIPPASPNLGLVVIRSDVALNNEEIFSPGETYLTTYRLQPDLSIVGDLYGTQDTDIQSFAIKSFVKRTETLSPRLTTDADSESEENWSRSEGKRKVDFSVVAEEVISRAPIGSINGKKPPSQLRDEIIEAVRGSEFRCETMRNWKSANMFSMDPHYLTSTIEQVGHRLEEEGYQLTPLHILPPTQAFDPEDDPGSISSIHSNLMSNLSSRGLDSSELNTKLETMREIAVDVGLANISIIKSNSSTESTTLSSLRKFLDVDAATDISNAATFVLAEWGISPEPAKPNRPMVRKRKRVKVIGSQSAIDEVIMPQPGTERNEARRRLSGGDEGASVTMSQPERGVHGTRASKARSAKSRRAGF